MQHWLKGIHKFVTNSNERKFFNLSFRYGNYERYRPVNIKFLQFNFSVPDALSFIWQFKEIFVEEYYRFETKSETLLYLIAVQMLEPVVPTSNSTIRNQELLLLNQMRRLRIIWQKTLKKIHLKILKLLLKLFG